MFDVYFYIIFRWVSGKTLNPSSTETETALGAIHPKDRWLYESHQEGKGKHTAKFYPCVLCAWHIGKAFCSLFRRNNDVPWHRLDSICKYHRFPAGLQCCTIHKAINLGNSPIQSISPFSICLLCPSCFPPLWSHMLGFQTLFPGACIHEVLLWAWEPISCPHTSLKGNLMWNSPAAWQNLSASPRLTHTPQPTSPSSYPNWLLPIFSIMLFLKCIYARPANNQIHLKPERTVQKEKRRESNFYEFKTTSQFEAAHTILAQTIGAFPNLHFNFSVLYHTRN